MTVSDNTVFSVGARYAIGPWKLFGGYENIHFANPNNPLLPGAFLQGGFIAVTANNNNFVNDKILQTAWVGVRYSITPALDITGAYYHEWQNSYGSAADANVPFPVAGSVVAGCTTPGPPNAPVPSMQCRWSSTGALPGTSTCTPV